MHISTCRWCLLLLLSLLAASLYADNWSKKKGSSNNNKPASHSNTHTHTDTDSWSYCYTSVLWSGVSDDDDTVCCYFTSFPILIWKLWMRFAHFSLHPLNPISSGYVYSRINIIRVVQEHLLAVCFWPEYQCCYWCCWCYCCCCRCYLRYVLHDLLVCTKFAALIQHSCSVWLLRLYNSTGHIRYIFCMCIRIGVKWYYLYI